MKLSFISAYILLFLTLCAAQPFLGEIRMFAGNFPPRGWALCNGQILPISENEGLFAVIGTIYGGNGRTTFALPDLRGRVPVHPGIGQGLSPVTEGQEFGAETTTLGNNNLPPHTHAASPDLKTEEGGSVDVDVSGITADTTVDLSNVETAERSISIPAQTCPVSGSGTGSSTGTVSVSTDVKVTKLFKAQFPCRRRKKCIRAFRVVLANRRETEHKTLTGSGTVSIENGAGGDAQCPAQNDLTVPGGPLSGTATATTTLTDGTGKVSIPSQPVTGTITIGSGPGSSQAFNIRQPSLGVNFIIALQGVFPSRN